MTLKQRIEWIIDHYKFDNPNDFAKKLGIRATKIYNVLEGKTNKSHTLIDEIANKLPNIDKQWLESGIGERLVGMGDDELESLKKEVQEAKDIIYNLNKRIAFLEEERKKMGLPPI